jgi:hypothetical protein
MLILDTVSAMLRNLLKSTRRQRGIECKIELNQITFEDSKPKLSEPIFGEHVAIQWSLTLERSRKFSRIKRLDVTLKLENASNLVKIFKVIPEDLKEEKARIQIGAGISVVNIGVNIPVARNVHGSRKTQSDEVEWLFEQVEFNGGNEVIIEGAIELAFLADSQNIEIIPTMFAHAIFESEGVFSRGTDEVRLNSEKEHVSPLKPVLADSQELTGAKAKELFPTSEILYYNPNGETGSLHRS